MTQVAVAEEKSFSDIEKALAYIQAEKAESIAKAREDFVRDEGRREGKREGKREGRREGRDEIECEIVRNMLKKNYDLASIVDVTGLSEDKIKSYSI